MSALAARFSIHRKKEYDQEDVKSIRTFMSKNYNDFISAYVSNLSDDDLIAMLQSVESRGVENSVPSTRAFYDLNLLLNDPNVSSVISGRVLSANPDFDKIAYMASKDLIKGNDPYFKTLKDSLANWCAKGSGLKVSFGSLTLDADEVAEILNQVIDEIEAGNLQNIAAFNKAIVAAQNIDAQAVKTRELSLSYVIGDEAKKFCAYYNQVSGTSAVSIKVSDLTDKKLFPDYVAQKTSVINDIMKTPQLIVSIYLEIEDEFKGSLPDDHYRYFFLEGLKSLPTPELRGKLLDSMVSVSVVDDRIKQVETDTFIQDVFTQVGRVVSADMIAALNSGTSNVKLRVF